MGDELLSIQVKLVKQGVGISPATNSTALPLHPSPTSSVDVTFVVIKMSSQTSELCDRLNSLFQEIQTGHKRALYI